MALFREIVAGIAAAAGFLGFYLGFDLRPWLALALALAIYFGVRFLLSGLGPDAEVAPGVTRGARDKAVARARQHAAQLGNAVRQLDDPAQADMLTGMARALHAIADGIAARPAELPDQQAFLDGYVPQSLQALQRYAEIHRTGAAVDPLLKERVAAAIPRMHQQFLLHADPARGSRAAELEASLDVIDLFD